MNGSRIKITDPRALAFAKIAQHTRVASTTLPGGMVTPEEEHIIIGDELVPADEAAIILAGGE